MTSPSVGCLSVAGSRFGFLENPVCAGKPGLQPPRLPFGGFTNFLYLPQHVWLKAVPACPYQIQHNSESVGAVIVIHKPLSAPGIGPSWQTRTMLRLSNRHYVNWHVQCNSLIRLN